MQSGAPVNHVTDDVLLVEHQIYLNLVVEESADFYTTNTCRQWSRPCPTYWTSVDDLWNELEHRIGHANAVKHSLHLRLGGVPPSDMELAQRQAVRAFTVGAKQSDYSSNVEIAPIMWSFWIGG